MTQLEREYFATFTLERLKAFYKAVAKETKFGNYDTYRCDSNGNLTHDDGSYVTRAWMRPNGKIIYMYINKRKIRNAILEREQSISNEDR